MCDRHRLRRRGPRARSQRRSGCAQYRLDSDTVPVSGWGLIDQSGNDPHPRPRLTPRVFDHPSVGRNRFNFRSGIAALTR